MSKPKIPRSGVYHGHFSGPVSFDGKPKQPSGLEVQKPSGPAHDAAPVETKKRMTPYIKKQDYQFRG